MDISHINMDHISEQKHNPSVSAIESYSARDQSGVAAGPHERQQDSFEMDSVRQYLRNLCETGQAQNHIAEILQSGIEPGCLRAELAFRAFNGDTASILIVINYLAGNFKEALKLTEQLADDGDNQKLAEFMLFSDYFAGRFDQGCNAAKNLASLNYSPFLCYAYADMLLSLGYVDESRTYMKKYVMFARRYLKNFVSEKEKYDDEKKRREQSSRRGRQNGKSGENADGQKEESTPQRTVLGVERDTNSSQSPALYDALKDMLARRRVLLDVLKTRNVSIDKRPLMFELEDIDVQISKITDKFGGAYPI